MDQNIRQLQDEMRKAATYDELILLEKRVNKLPTMQNVNNIEEKLEDYTKLDLFIRFKEDLENQLTEIREIGL